MPNIELLHIDCMEYLKSLPDKSFELAIIDPPYGINAPNMQMGTNPNRTGIDKNGDKQYGGVSTTSKLKGRLNSGGGEVEK